MEPEQIREGVLALWMQGFVTHAGCKYSNKLILAKVFFVGAAAPRAVHIAPPLPRQDIGEDPPMPRQDIGEEELEYNIRT